MKDQTFMYLELDRSYSSLKMSGISMLYRFYDPVGRPRIIILIPVLSVDTILLSFQYFVPAFPDQSVVPH